MKKFKFLAIPVLAALLFAGCGEATAEANKAPSVTGVKDIQCMVNSTVDFLDGVAALDKEDGDITPDMKITVTPTVEVTADGYAHFTQVGEYTVTYSVADSKGRVAQKRAYVDVVDRDTYKTFAMPEGFTADAFGGAKIDKCGMTGGKFVLEASGGEIAEDIRLTRTYTMTTGLQYTFTYRVNSNVAGKVKVLADGYNCAEIAVKSGENDITFTHTARSAEKEDKQVTIDICLGSLGSAKWTVESVECEYPQAEGKLVELAENFSFNERVERRIDSDKDGQDNGLRGNAWAGSEGKTACLEITVPCDEAWRGGMFIKTEIPVKAGVTYNISFDVERDKENDFEVLLQNAQWIGDDDALRILGTPVGKTRIDDLTIPDGKDGYLWIYVRSGNAENEIRLSNLSVQEKLGAVGKESFIIEDFTEFHANGCDSTLVTGNESFTYTVNKFAAAGGDNQVKSPRFFIAGSGTNYVVSFKAKASAPIEMVVAAPVFGGWDPTLMWAKVNLTEDEAVYTFFCYNKQISDRTFNIVWQFGSVVNQKYENVKIEISDIKISMKKNGLDG